MKDRLETTWGCYYGVSSARMWSEHGSGKPGSITPHTKFMAQVYILKKEEGGDTAILQWVSATVLHSHDGLTGSVKLPEGVEMVSQGTM